MMRLNRSACLSAIHLGLLSIGVALGGGCTTKFSDATDAYAKGEFAMAAEKADKLCPTKLKDGAVRGLDVEYRRDRLWIGLEKGKILAEAGRGAESIDLLRYVWKEADDLREIESWYLENPLDMGSWDAGQFLEDVGQLVVGADQTTYLLQPYEMILLRTYLCLESLLDDVPGAEAEARGALELQQFEAEDLARAGENVAQPPLGRLDQAIGGAVPSGKTTDLNSGSIFSLGDFGKARQSMRDAIDSASRLRAADPRIAFSTVVQWAAHVKSANAGSAKAAAEQVAKLSGANALSQQMLRLSGKAGYEEQWVLVLVEAGRGPTRGSFKVSLPIFIPTVGGTMFIAVYPHLRFRADDRPASIAVSAGGRDAPAAVLTSIDAIVARNFQRREVELWWTPTIRAVIRAVAGIVAQATQEDDNYVGKLVAGLASTAFAVAEQPDLRAWSTLPASQHAVIVPRPADGRLSVRFQSNAGQGEARVEVPPGSSVVYVRALNAGTHATRVASLLRPQGASAAAAVRRPDGGTAPAPSGP